ncbi:MAG TPA: GFA family protein [Alphaproteobacteria bacterium]|nr:GFA family protein [Alphaproteobacteria bacterium]
MAETHTGRCFCGAVEIETTGAPLEMGYCHCSSCRAWSGSPFAAFKLWPSQSIKVTKGADLLGRYAKTKFSERRFCTRCGGHIMAEHPSIGCSSVEAAIVPGVAFKPEVHLNYAEAVMRITDGLPKLKDFPAAAGGSGETIPE